jgi:hypothetical protein
MLDTLTATDGSDSSSNDLLKEHARDSGLSDARFSCDEDELAFTVQRFV